MNIEQRLQRLEDRAAIGDLVVNYFLAADGDDFSGVSDSFSDEATFRTSGVLSAEGKSGIVEFIRTARRSMGLTIHTPNYCQVRFIDDETATGLVGAHLELVLGQTPVYGAVRYVDLYRRIEGHWLITDRDMRTVHLAQWDEVASAFPSSKPVRWPGMVELPSDYPRSS